MRRPRDRDLHGDQTTVVALDLVAIMTTSRPPILQPVLIPLCTAAITPFSLPLCSGRVNALRVRFDRAFRAAFGH